MVLLVRYVYPVLLGYAKANIIFYLKIGEDDEIAKPLNKHSIPLTLDDGTPISKSEIYGHVFGSILKLLEIYDGYCVVRIAIRAHFQDDIKDPPCFKEELLEEVLSECIKPASVEFDISNLPVKSLRSTSRVYSKYITVPRKSGKIKLSPFLVADTETIIIDNSHHVPYAVGVMVVNPGIPVRLDNRIDTYFSEDYSSRVFPTFEERSTQMLKSFIFRVAAITRQNTSAKTIYFHNLGRFDGIFLLKHLALYHPNYTVKPLMRDNRLYEIAVYSKHKRLLFTFRDSLHLLPGKLDEMTLLRIYALS
jgi:hypothetical protein